MTFERSLLLDSGTHSIFLEAKNGDLISKDTLTIHVSSVDQWRVFPVLKTKSGRMFHRRPEKEFYFVDDYSSDTPFGKFTNDSITLFAGWSTEQWFHPTIELDKMNRLWASSNGIGFYDGQYWTVYPKSGPSFYFKKVAIDKNGETWFKVRAEGAPWIIDELHLLKNSAIERIDSVRKFVPQIDYKNSYNNYGINDLTADSSGNLWMTVTRSMASLIPSALLKYDGVAWDTVSVPQPGLAYDNNSNAGLHYINFDRNNHLYITYEFVDSKQKPFTGFLKFDGNSWTDNKFNVSSPLYFDTDNNAWFIGGEPLSLVRFGGINYTLYNSTNSPFTTGSIISIDTNNNIWLACGEKTVVFNPNGIVGLKAATSVSEDFTSVKNSFKTSPIPNPAQHYATIHYSLKTESPVSLFIYNSLGIEVFKNNLGFKNIGDNSETISTSKLPTGQYYYVLKAGAQQSTHPLVIVR